MEDVVEDWEEIGGKETLSLTIDLRRIYEGDGICTLSEEEEERVDLKDISKKFNCSIELYYEGEDREDSERMTFSRGKITMHEMIGWIRKI